MKIQYIYTAISILLWATIATISKLFFTGLDPYFILFYSSFFASLVLLVYNAKNLKQQVKESTVKDVIEGVAIGSLGIFFYNYFLQRGIAILPAQIAFVINYLWPAFIIIFSCFILKEKMTYGKGAAILFSFIGVATVATNGSLSNLMGGNISGILFCVLAAVCYGLYTPLNKRGTYNKDFALLMTYAASTVLALLVTIINGTLALPTLFQLAGLILYGLGADAIAYVTWVKAMDQGNTAIISNLAYLTPVVSLVFTHFILGEAVTLYSVLGLVLIFTGIIIQFKSQKNA